MKNIFFIFKTVFFNLASLKDLQGFGVVIIIIITLFSNNIFAQPCFQKLAVGNTGSTSHFAAIKTDGSLWIWGNNLFGAVACGNTTDQPAPILNAITDAKNVYIGGAQTYVIKTNGTLWAAGDNRYNQCGNPNFVPQVTTFQQVNNDTDWAYISASRSQVFGLKTDGSLWVWGDNWKQSFGLPALTTAAIPTRTGSLTTWKAVAAGGTFSLAITTDGKLYSVGENIHGQLGTGNTTNHSSWTRIGTRTDWATVSVSEDVAFATTTVGNIYAWGNGAYNLLGTNSTAAVLEPQIISTMGGFTKVTVGNRMGGALHSNGTIWSWGENQMDNLDQNQPLLYPTMRPVGCDNRWTDLQIEVNNNFALRNDNSMWVSGNNASGCLGLGAANPYMYWGLIVHPDCPAPARECCLDFALNGGIAPTSTCAGACNGGATVMPNKKSGAFGAADYPLHCVWSNGFSEDLNNFVTGTRCITLCAGTHTVTVSTAQGCTGSTQITVQTTAAPPSITFQNIQGASCIALGSAEVYRGPLFNPATFAWDNGTTTYNAALTGGTHTVTVTDGRGCTGSATVNIPFTNSNISVSTTILQTVKCSRLGSIAVNAPPNATVQWSTGETTTTIGNLAAGTYSVTVTAAGGGCATSTSVILTEQPNTINYTMIGSLSPTCSQAGYVVLQGIGGVAPYSFDIGNGAVADTIFGLLTGTYDVTVTDFAGCTNYGYIIMGVTLNTVEVNVNLLQNVSCTQNGRAEAIGLGGVAPYSYAWSDGTTAALNTNLGLGIYTVTTTDASNCSATKTVSIANANLPQIAFQHVHSFCVGRCNGRAEAIVTSGSAPYTFAWSSGETTAAATQLCSANDTYSVTVTDAGGCTVASSIGITRLAVANATNTDVRCFGANDGTATVIATGEQPLTYTWSQGINTTNTHRNLGVGTVFVTIYDAAGCSKVANFTINEPERIIFAIITESPYCTNDTTGRITVKRSRGGIGAPYTFSINDNSAQTDSVFYGLQQGTHIVTVSDANGCTTTRTSVLTAIFNLQTTAKGDTTIYLGESAPLRARTNAFNGITYTWQPAEGLSCVACRNTIATPTETTVYTVVATNADGCTDASTVTVQVKERYEVYIPNTFTPNDDGKNDIFRAYTGANVKAIKTMLIADRWGELIYFENDLPLNSDAKAWDGTFKTQKLPPDVFVYYIEIEFINGKTKIFKGDVSLVY